MASSPELLVRARIAAAVPSAGVHPVMASQNAPFPLVVYRRTSTKRERGLNGTFPVPIGMFSVAIVSETYSELKELASAIRVSLNNFTGSGQGAKIITSALVSESDNMEPPLEGRDKPLYRVDQVYEIRFEE